MHSYIEACAAHDNARRIGPILDRIIPEAALHARFVNTLARMEYVGVRKLLKSRRAESLDLDGLQHMLDESVHALRLKRAATTLAEKAALNVPGLVRTFADADTLAGAAGEGYLQSLDHRAEVLLGDLAPAGRAEVNHLLTTAAIEVRAHVFYPIYDQRLAAHRCGFSVASIAKDEDRHLADMEIGLGRALTDWPDRLGALMADEERLFGGFLDQLDRAAAVARAA